MLARRLIEAGLDDEAAYNFGVLERSGVAEGAYALGILSARRGQMEEALRLFERARELNPSHEETGRQIVAIRQLLGWSLEEPHAGDGGKQD